MSALIHLTIQGFYVAHHIIPTHIVHIDICLHYDAQQHGA